MWRGDPRGSVILARLGATRVKVLGGSASQRTAKELAGILGADLVPIERKLFPDGEVYVRVPQVLRGEHAVVVQSTLPASGLVEAIFLQEAAHDQGASEISMVAPYFSYSR